MQIEYMLSHRTLKEKPNDIEIKIIQKNFKKCKSTVKELYEYISSGKTFKPAVLTSTTSDSWISQQIFALDFDNSPNILSEIELAKSLNILPSFGYETFSHSEDNPKFRLVFISSYPVLDKSIRDVFQKLLIEKFPNADRVTYDPTRMFFPGIRSFEVNFNNLIDPLKILKDSKRSFSHTYNKVSFSMKKAHFEYSNIDLIEMLNSEELSKRINKINKNVYSDKEVYDNIYSINFYEFLGVDKGFFRCILPEHNDKTPSAHIYRNSEGMEFYKCFGCGKVFTVISIVEKLSGCSRSKAIEFLKETYGIIKENDEWVERQKNILLNNIKFLDSKEFEEIYPNLSKILRKRKFYLQKILIQFIEYLTKDMSFNDKPLFYCNYETLMKVTNTNIKDRNAISKTIALYALLGLMDKISEENIPNEFLMKSKFLSQKKKYHKIVNYFSVDEYGYKLLEEVEFVAKHLIDNNFTIQGLSREFVLRTFGVDYANIIYPQYKNENAKGTSEKSNTRTEKIIEMIFKDIEEKGFCLESDVKISLANELQYKKSINEILKGYNLKRITANSYLKEKYGLTDLPERSYPKILIKNLEN